METNTIRRETIQQLPSHNFNAVNIKNSSMCSAKKERKYSIEVFKLNKKLNGNLRRRITRDDVEQIAELMLHSKIEIRDLDASLVVKKQIARVINEMLLEEQQVQANIKCIHILTTIKDSWMKFWNMCDLWCDSIKKIHGSYGSEVVIYFTFLRYLVFMNILNIIIVLLLVVGPQATRNFYHLDHIEHKGSGNSGNVSFALQDVLSGSGSLQDSLLYYKGYQNGSFSGYFGSKTLFDASLSYLFANISLFFVNLIFISYSLCMQFRNSSVIRTHSNVSFCREVFNSWDFGILTEKAALIKKQNICVAMKELLHQKWAKEHVKEQYSKIEIAQVVLLYAWVLSLSVIVLCVFYDQLTRFAILERIGLFHKLSIPIYVSSSTLALHYLIRFLTKHETFLSEKIRIYFIAFRTLVFRLGMLVVLLYFWIPGAEDRDKTEKHAQCFENSEGKEMFRISVITFIIDTLVLLLFFGVVWLLVYLFGLHHALKDYLPEFNVAFHITDLIFYQTLIWVGTLYVPLLSVTIVIILILNFYIMKHSLSWCYVPSKQCFSCSVSNIFFLSLLLIALIFCLFNNGYKIFYIQPSTTCGPFKYYKFAYDKALLWAQNITVKDTALGSFMKFIQAPSLVISLILSLMVVIYFIRAHYVAFRRTVKFLEQQLQEEEEYKSILLRIYEEKKKKPA